MKRLTLTIAFSLAVSFCLLAQEFSLNDFLGSVYEDPLVRNVYDQSDYLRSADMRTPNINEVELRTRSDNTDLTLDDVRLRLTFTNFGEIRQGSAYNELLIENYDLEYNVRVHAALTHRYQLVFDHLSIFSELELLQKQKLNLEDQIKVEKGDILNSKGDVSDLAELELDYTSLVIKESGLMNKLTMLQSMITSLYQFEGSVTLESNNLIGPEDIKTFIETENEALHPEIALREQDVKLGLQEIELEKKESNGDFGFIQAEYDIDPDNETTENLGYQVGFNIPITNPDKADIGRSKLKNLKQKQSLDNMISENAQRMAIMETELIELINQYEYLQKQYYGLLEANRSISGNYLQIKSLLTMQENELQLEKALQKQRTEIFIAYLNWLDKSGAISVLPFRNYLYRGNPEITD